MTDRKYTYRLNRMLLILLAWEVIFWGLYFVLIMALGFFGDGKGDEILLYRHPERFLWMLLIAPIVIAFTLFVIKHNKRALALNKRVREAYIRPVSEGYTLFKWIMFRNVIVFMIIAFAQPVFGKRKSEATVENLELVICLDVSNSMNTKDISDEMSRLEIAKRAMIELVNNLHGERIGICLFANDALVQLPVTRDYGAAKLFIKEIETDLVGSQGTNIKSALEVSRKMFSKDRTAKGIIMVTDGENHESNPNDVLKKIRESKIQLCVLGIGTEKGGLVPVNPRRPDLGYKKTATGKTVRSKVNPKMIESIASKAGGKASLSADEFPDLSALLTQITRMKRTKIDNFDFDIRTERYQIPLVFALISWLIYLLWSEKLSARLNKRLESK
ncbi:MAG: VWA domain-containing protein [bacterium]|nr:VWA domain-containing protein [bacterium]